MILLAHLLFGAVVGSFIKNIYLALILAFLGHYFLDVFPHVEYSIENIKEKKWRKSFSDFFKIFFDFLIGILIIFIFSYNLPIKKQAIIYLCAILSIAPDGLTFLYILFPNKLLKFFLDFHKKIHFLKVHQVKYEKNIILVEPKLFNWEIKISNFWRVLIQIIFIFIFILLLI